jgi:hypothetical protein
MENKDAVVYDNSFTIEKQRWGTYTSIGLDGEKLITSLTEELCISATRFYLKGRQEGWDSAAAELPKPYDSFVGGKL